MAEEKKLKFTLELTEEEIINGKHPHVLPINPRQLKSILEKAAKEALHKAWAFQSGLIGAATRHEIEKIKSNQS